MGNRSNSQIQDTAARKPAECCGGATQPKPVAAEEWRSTDKKKPETTGKSGCGCD